MRQRQNGEAADTPPATDPPRLLTAAEAAARCGLTRARLYALAREDRIGGVVHTGERQVRFDPVELEHWIRAGGESSV